MARAFVELSTAVDSIFTVDVLARGLAQDCHKFADFDFMSEGHGTCPCGGFTCPLRCINCNEVTAEDWLRILEVEE